MTYLVDGNFRVYLYVEDILNIMSEFKSLSNARMCNNRYREDSPRVLEHVAHPQSYHD